MTDKERIAELEVANKKLKAEASRSREEALEALAEKPRLKLHLDIERAAHAETKRERDALAIIIARELGFEYIDGVSIDAILVTYDAEVQRKSASETCQAIVAQMCGEEIASTGSAEPTVENVCGWWKLDLERIQRKVLERVMACKPARKTSRLLGSAWAVGYNTGVTAWATAIEREFQPGERAPEADGTEGGVR